MYATLASQPATKPSQIRHTGTDNILTREHRAHNRTCLNTHTHVHTCCCIVCFAYRAIVIEMGGDSLCRSAESARCATFLGPWAGKSRVCAHRRSLLVAVWRSLYDDDTFGCSNAERAFRIGCGDLSKQYQLVFPCVPMIGFILVKIS